MTLNASKIKKQQILKFLYINFQSRYYPVSPLANDSFKFYKPSFDHTQLKEFRNNHDRFEINEKKFIKILGGYWWTSLSDFVCWIPWNIRIQYIWISYHAASFISIVERAFNRNLIISQFEVLTPSYKNKIKKKLLQFS